jgi:Ca2+-binding RTX toxin-like protein
LITGSAGNDSLTGANSADVMNAGDGDDTLSGAGTLLGGNGSDHFVINAGGALAADGGSGVDYIELFTFSAMSLSTSQLLSASGVNVEGTQISNFETFRITDAVGAADTLTIDTNLIGGQNFWIAGDGPAIDTLVMNFGNVVYDINTGATSFYIQTPTGELDWRGVEAFQLTTGSGTDTLIGGNYDDMLSSGAGNDVLDGGGGTNVLLGGSGDDALYSSGVGDTVDGGDGADRANINRTTSSLSFQTTSADLTSSSGTTLADGTIVRNVETFVLQTGSGDDSLVVTSLPGQEYFSANGGTDHLTIDLSTSNLGYAVQPGLDRKSVV